MSLINSNCADTVIWLYISDIIYGIIRSHWYMIMFLVVTFICFEITNYSWNGTLAQIWFTWYENKTTWFILKTLLNISWLFVFLSITIFFSISTYNLDAHLFHTEKLWTKKFFTSSNRKQKRDRGIDEALILVWLWDSVLSLIHYFFYYYTL